KVDGDDKIEPLELGSDIDLAELTELIACGFPFGLHANTARVAHRRKLALGSAYRPNRRYARSGNDGFESRRPRAAICSDWLGVRRDSGRNILICHGS